MKRLFLALSFAVLAAVVTVYSIGCAGKAEANDWPTFSLAWSEYPSWSVYGVAAEKGLITGKKSAPGTLEKKYKVIIELKQVDYDTCMTMYGSNTVDGTCMTNMDSLSPSLGRPSTAILPTSTSFGADACVAVDGIDSPEKLKGIEVYGLEKSVSEYAFVRCLQVSGLNPDNFKFKNMDPSAAATAMQTNQKGIKAIMVWNPFVMQTLRTVKGSKRLFDSSKIPGEIIDMVVIGNDALEKKGGDDFAKCLCEAYYEVNKLMGDPDEKKANATYVALGAKFSSLNAEDMRRCCKETKFYGTPKDGISIFTGTDLFNNNKRVANFCLERGIIKKMPELGYDRDGSALNFSTKYMQSIK